MSRTDFVCVRRHHSASGPWETLRVVAFEGREEMSRLVRYELYLLAGRGVDEPDPEDLIGQRGRCAFAPWPSRSTASFTASSSKPRTSPTCPRARSTASCSRRRGSAPRNASGPEFSSRRRSGRSWTRCSSTIHGCTSPAAPRVKPDCGRPGLRAGARAVHLADFRPQPRRRRARPRLHGSIRRERSRVRLAPPGRGGDRVPLRARRGDLPPRAVRFGRGAASRGAVGPGIDDRGADPLRGPAAAARSTRSGSADASAPAASSSRTTPGTNRASASRPTRRPSAPMVELEERYYPGGFPDSPDQGRLLAHAVADLHKIEAEIARGEGTARVLGAGSIFTLEHQKARFAGEYLVTRALIHGEQAGVVSVDSARDLFENVPFRIAVELRAPRRGRTGAREPLPPRARDAAAAPPRHPAAFRHCSEPGRERRGARQRPPTASTSAASG